MVCLIKLRMAREIFLYDLKKQFSPVVLPNKQASGSAPFGNPYIFSYLGHGQRPLPVPAAGKYCIYNFLTGVKIDK